MILSEPEIKFSYFYCDKYFATYFKRDLFKNKPKAKITWCFQNYNYLLLR